MYIRPQENGYKTDVGYVSFSDDAGIGIQFEGFDAPICFSARDNFDEDFDSGSDKQFHHHLVNIPLRAAIFVNIDLKQLGLGRDESWNKHPLPQYRMFDDAYSYSYVIRPLSYSTS